MTLADRIRAAWLERKEEHEARFWDKVAVCGEDDCWNWLASLWGSDPKHARGRYSVGGISVSATRFSFMVANPDAQIDGLFVLHSCDNPLCVNPAHLFLGTHRDNMDDMIAKGRGSFQREQGYFARITSKGHKKLADHPELRPHGETHHYAKLSLADAVAIYQSKAKTRKLAETYNVSMSAVQRIRNGSQWRTAILTEIERRGDNLAEALLNAIEEVGR